MQLSILQLSSALSNSLQDRPLQPDGAALSPLHAAPLEAEGHKPLGVEGMAQSKWILIDLGDILVHVFDESMRGYYDLDGLWIDANRVTLEQLGLDEHGDPLEADSSTPSES